MHGPLNVKPMGVLHVNKILLHQSHETHKYTVQKNDLNVTGGIYCYHWTSKAKKQLHLPSSA